MCFGDTKTQTSTNTQSLPSWLSGAAQNNINYAQSLQSKGFTPYTGQQVADFSPQQRASFGLGTDVANSVQPYVGQAGGLISNYANAGPQSVNADTIASAMSPYMNAYVRQSLAPQLEAQNQQFAGQNKAFDAGATMAGAYGDTGWGLGRTNLTNQQDLARQGLIGNAYNAAFNTAIGAGAQDVANNLNAQETNANLAETALGRQLTGANALFGEGANATNLVNTLGGQQTAQSQAQLNAPYNQWLMAQQYPFQTTQLMDQAISAGRMGAPVTSTATQSAPDNSGFGILGSIAGSAASAFLADGGSMQPGQPTVVGERGPEVLVPNTTGVVIPNEVLQAARLLRAAKLGGAGAPPATATQFGIAA